MRQYMHCFDVHIWDNVVPLAKFLAFNGCSWLVVSLGSCPGLWLRRSQGPECQGWDWRDLSCKGTKDQRPTTSGIKSIQQPWRNNRNSFLEIQVFDGSGRVPFGQAILQLVLVGIDETKRSAVQDACSVTPLARLAKEEELGYTMNHNTSTRQTTSVDGCKWYKQPSKTTTHFMVSFFSSAFTWIMACLRSRWRKLRQNTSRSWRSPLCHGSESTA